jgi:two-component system nitrogen regulation response regulator NtrX
VLLDVWLQAPSSTACSFSRRSSGRDPALPVLMISGHGNLDTAVGRDPQGAVDFIEKPFEAGSSCLPPSSRARPRPTAAPRE